MMIEAIMSVLSKKGYCYFSGTISPEKEKVYFVFSTLLDERGEVVDITIDEKNNVAHIDFLLYNPKYQMKFGPNDEHPYISIKKENIPLNKLSLIIMEVLK